MPTLAEYEARGIDITLMTTEQLIAEGYTTPLNELPTVITTPGDYRTRNGRRVTIHGIKPTTTLATTAFSADGSVWKTPTQMGINPQYSIWHVSGRHRTWEERGWDIIGKWA